MKVSEQGSGSSPGGSTGGKPLALPVNQTRSATRPTRPTRTVKPLEQPEQPEEKAPPEDAAPPEGAVLTGQVSVPEQPEPRATMRPVEAPAALPPRKPDEDMREWLRNAWRAEAVAEPEQPEQEGSS